MMMPLLLFQFFYYFINNFHLLLFLEYWYTILAFLFSTKEENNYKGTTIQRHFYIKVFVLEFLFRSVIRF